MVEELEHADLTKEAVGQSLAELAQNEVVADAFAPFLVSIAIPGF